MEWGRFRKPCDTIKMNDRLRYGTFGGGDVESAAQPAGIASRAGMRLGMKGPL
jgi:hypothetical protein